MRIRGLSMENVGQRVNGFIIDVVKDDAGEEDFLVSLPAFREKLCCSVICGRVCTLDGQQLALIYDMEGRTSKKNVSAIKPDGTTMYYGNILIAGADLVTSGVPQQLAGEEVAIRLRDLTDDELEAVLKNLAIMTVEKDTGKDGAKDRYSTYCLCNMEAKNGIQGMETVT